MSFLVSKNLPCNQSSIRSSADVGVVPCEFSCFTLTASGRLLCIRRSQYIPYPNQVESGQGKQQIAFRVDLADDSHLPHSTDCFQPPEDFFDALSDSNADGITFMSSRASIDVGSSTIGRVLRNMRRVSQLACGFNEVRLVVPFIRSHRLFLPIISPAHHGQGRIPLRKAGGRVHFAIHCQPVPVFHFHMGHMADFSRLTGGLLRKPGLRIRRGRMRIVGPRLAVKIHRGVTTGPIGRITAPIFGPERFERRPGFDQSTIDAEMLVRKQVRQLWPYPPPGRKIRSQQIQ